MNQLPKLYCGQDTCSLGPELVLEETGRPYERMTVSLSNGDNRTDRYLEMNPTGQVPVLVFPDGRILTESAAIMLYFSETDEKGTIATFERTDPRHWDLVRRVHFFAGSLSRAFGMMHVPFRFSDKADCHASASMIGKDTLCRYWGILDEDRVGPYFYGEEFSLVDVLVAMHLSWRPFSTRDMIVDLFPNLGALLKRLHSRPAIARVVERHRDAKNWTESSYLENAA